MTRTTTSPLFVVILSLMVAFGPLSIDMYLPALPQITADLGATASQLQLTIGIFLGGFSTGVLFYGPLSDRFGRRRILLIGITLYLLASVGCLLATSAPQLIFWRLVQGLGGAAASVLARAIVRDVFPIGQAASMLSWMHLTTMIATLLAPLAGSYLLVFFGWRIIFGGLILIALTVLAAICLRVPETLPPQARATSVMNAFLAYRKVLGNSRSMGFILSMGLCFGGMFVYLTATPFVFINYFGMTPQQYAWLFAMNIGSVMVLTFLNTRLLKIWTSRRLLFIGASLVMASGIALAVFASTGIGGLASIIACLLLFVGCTGMMGANAIANLLARHQAEAGAAAGLAVSTQFGLGMVLSSSTAALHTDGPVAMGVLMCCAGIACWIAALVALRPESTT